ncbi:MAG: hypothetical protein IKU80_05955, partial [Firmicutes bacterium]|nr:hypothetical protein [Bacillota bacterium]
MIFIGDFFALVLVIILFMFFFNSKTGLRHMPTSSKIFIASLVSAALTAGTDIATGYMFYSSSIPIWINMLGNSIYFILNIITTSLIAIYMFIKLLEHTHHRGCMRNACIGLAILFAVYTAVVFANIKTGWLFYFDANGRYCRGPFNGIGYVTTLCQMVLVLICFFRNKETAGKPMRRVLLQTFPVIPLCFAIQRIFPEIMLNSIIIAFVETIIFLTFQGQRHGVHSLTELNDRHRFFADIDARIAKKEPFQIFF